MMAITDRSIDAAFSALSKTYGGVRDNYLGLLYLKSEFGLEQDRAITQLALGGNDYGIHGYHFDGDKRNLYLFQFKDCDSHTQIKQSFSQLIETGMERVFGEKEDQKDQLLLRLKSCLVENENLIDRVCIYFVSSNKTAVTERSQVIDRLREDLENKKHVLDRHFGRNVTMVIEFRSAKTRTVGPVTRLRKTHTYPIRFDQAVTRSGPNGEVMAIGFIPLSNLCAIYREMGQRFFERNIRAALAEDESVNRSIQQSLKRIVFEGKEDARVFAFNHNGVTLSAEALDINDDQIKITEPRLLNGAQTVTTFARFLSKNENNKALKEGQDALESIYVICRIITKAVPELVTTITINNNRQNPVEPWHLHANDMIQLEIQDKFRDDLGIYYERQERAFQNLSEEDLYEQGIKEPKAIELTRLARTFLASDGDIDKLAHFREVFEDDRIYNQVFDKGRLKADFRKIVLCYKAQFRIRRLMNDIVEIGANKYAYIQRARNLLWGLLCQAILNDPNIEERAEEFGHALNTTAQYTDWLSSFATTRCRFILSDLVEDKAYAPKAAEGNFSFMRANAAYKRSMEIAHKRYKWTQKRLK